MSPPAGVVLAKIRLGWSWLKTKITAAATTPKVIRSSGAGFRSTHAGRRNRDGGVWGWGPHAPGEGGVGAPPGSGEAAQRYGEAAQRYGGAGQLLSGHRGEYPVERDMLAVTVPPAGLARGARVHREVAARERD